MAEPIVECIPNFSESRRKEVVDEISRSIGNVTQIDILDRHSDDDHNRSVITFIGPPKSVLEAAFQAIKTAANLIDLSQHTGAHPRIGATDVVPFVPISGVSMEDCVRMARSLGNRVGKELGIPVYLYEEAASHPDRKNLETLRHGQYEGLLTEITTNPDRKPDFGPCELGPAGATVIGARQHLIAFNVYLTTSDASVARKIARTVRNSSGGLRYVKALGLQIHGLAQVSMNLIDYRHTPVELAVELIRIEAKRYGAAIHHTELVGMIPQDALINAARWHLQLDEFNLDQVLESKIYQVRETRTQSTNSGKMYLDQLSEVTTSPGGGSAAAFCGAQAAALTAMAAGILKPRFNSDQIADRMQMLNVQSNELKDQIFDLVDKDKEAYTRLSTALRLPKQNLGEQEKRRHEIIAAALEASDIPLQVVKASLTVMDIALEIMSVANPSLLPDLINSFYQARAAFDGSAINIRSNINQFLADSDEAGNIINELEKLETEAAAFERQFREKNNNL